ncbi:DUF1343 domain-containing protein [Putridiphycobacter roseus]|uniref:DUF1343 domain-containing protein n=1 Tax=Putridiphycobacter roseus TaxID=2219161 RepID=A0A2W1N0F1_9FLAO|nr:DUF1343 domain-containing protein [Putridiphycobacter roseus]PZE18019.1 DUF1343 domain-containing protein [Putridiphycobacter roseus]
MLKPLLISFLCVFCTLVFGQVNQGLYQNDSIVVGAANFENYLPLLEGKRVGLVGNQTSMVGERHLVDILLEKQIKVVQLFSPEHGFRGEADAGEKVASKVDPITQIPIISLYGSNKKPTDNQLKNLDVLLFDLQDVGVRFYTYISTLHYVMEACAENKVQLIVLDRPNPNGHYVDGPVLDRRFKSFVGMHPVSIVHGMTIGEYATMINGEGWLKSELKCPLKIVLCKGWNHQKFYKLPIKPSPNLPNMLSVYLYPSICLFEGTVVSVGRGTAYPFQQIGHPSFNAGSYYFTPKPNVGAKNPKLNGKVCNGVNFTETGINVLQNQNQMQLDWFLKFYENLNLGANFFLPNHFIDLLMGSDQFRKMVVAGKTEEEIRATWKTELDVFKLTRQNYLLYTDFN